MSGRMFFAGPFFGDKATRRSRALPILLVVVLSGVATMRLSRSFVGGLRSASARLPSDQNVRASFKRETAMMAFDWDANSDPGLPSSTEAMIKDAADAVMRAYREGYTRQNVRLLFSEMISMDGVYDGGIQALLNATLPGAERFTEKLWGGESLKGVRASVVDGEVSTLIYREAENAMQDAAVLFLAGREMVTSIKADGFFRKMGDRLVVLANVENAVDNFKIGNMGKEFALENKGDKGYQICEMFKEQSYYYSIDPVNNWQTITFRAFPFPWTVYIEDLKYQKVKIGESDTKPTYDQIIAWMDAYEEKENVLYARKLTKMLKDQAPSV